MALGHPVPHLFTLWDFRTYLKKYSVSFISLNSSSDFCANKEGNVPQPDTLPLILDQVTMTIYSSLVSTGNYIKTIQYIQRGILICYTHQFKVTFSDNWHVNLCFKT